MISHVIVFVEILFDFIVLMFAHRVSVLQQCALLSPDFTTCHKIYIGFENPVGNRISSGFRIRNYPHRYGILKIGLDCDCSKSIKKNVHVLKLAPL